MFSGFPTSDGLTFYSNPPRTSRYIPGFLPTPCQSQPWPVRDLYARYLPNQSLEERRENQRLEEHRRQLIASMARSSSNGLGSPGPTLPRSVRQRAANLSEGEISVFDLGPSLQATPIPASRIHRNTGLLRENPALYTALDSLATDNGRNERRLCTEDLESEAVSSASEDIPNPHPFSQCERRRNVMISRGPELANFGTRPGRQLRDSRVASSDDVQSLGHGYGYGYGYSMQDNHLHFSDESNSHVMARSVPHSPRSPPAPLRRVLYPLIYYGVVGPEHSNLRTVEQANNPTSGNSSADPRYWNEENQQSDAFEKRWN